MSTRLYLVALTDLGTYRVTVAADTPEEACRIAKDVLQVESTQLPPDARLVKRETEAMAEVSSHQPASRFEVDGLYQLGFTVTVPASDADEAERHVRRLFDLHCGPFEFENDGGMLIRLKAQEVQS